MKHVRRYSAFLLFVFSVCIPITVYANPVFSGNQESNLNDHVGNWTQQVNGLAPTVSFMFSAIFTIMFLFGVIRMGYSLITKTGHVMKFSTGLMIWVPITFFLIRIFIILLFTTDSNGVTLLASDMISLIRSAGYFSALGMVLIGLVLYLIYRLIDHPEHGRWSKRLWVSAALISIAISIMPWILGATT